MKLFKHNLAFVSAIIMVLFMVPCFVFAQEEATEVQIDETVTAQDLGVGEQNILPGSFWYGFKEMWRGVQTALTFNDVNKAELKLEHANERLLEVQKLVDLQNDENKVELLNKAMEKYEIDLVKIQEITAKIQEKAANNPQLDAFIDRLGDSEIKRYKVMEKIQEHAPEEVLEKITAVRERQKTNFGQIVQQLVREDNIVDKIEKMFNDQKGSELKDLKNLQIVKELKESLPSDIQDKFAEIEAGLKQRLEEQLKNVDVEAVKNYLENMRGDETIELEIMSQLRNSGMVSVEMKQKIQASENEVKTRLQQRVENIENAEIREKVINNINDDFQKYNPNLIKSLNRIHERKMNAESSEDTEQVEVED